MKNNAEEKESPETKDENNKNSGSITFNFTKKTLKYIATFTVLIVLFYWGLNNTEKVSSIVNGFLAVIKPFIIGVLCFIGMLIFRMPYAAVISVLVGSTALIPVFGAFIGTAIGAFLILFVSPVKAVWFVVFIIVLQQLEGNLIYPKVVGKSVGLPGIWVLTAVTIGGSLFGVIGILVSVPLCSVLYTLFGQFVANRLKSKKLKT